MRKLSLVLFGGLFLLAMAAITTAALAAADGLRPIGSFSKVEGDDGEHSNGHRIQLWQVGNKLIGQLTYWESSIEGQSGDFIDGVIDEKTGKIKFRVTVERRDIDPKELSTAKFSGQISGNVLQGSLKWEGEATEFRGEKGLESLMLSKDTSVKLLYFATLAAWQNSPYEREK